MAKLYYIFSKFYIGFVFLLGGKAKNLGIALMLKCDLTYVPPQTTADFVLCFGTLTTRADSKHNQQIKQV